MIWPFARSKTLQALDATALELAEARARRIVAQQAFLAALDGLEPGSTLKVNGAHYGKSEAGKEQGGVEVEVQAGRQDSAR